MTVLFFEGWDLYSHSSSAETVWSSKGWTAIGNWSSSLFVTGRYGGTAASNSSSSSDITFRHDFGSTKTTVIMGCAVQQVTTGTLTKAIRLLEFMDGTSVQCGLGIDTSRRLFVYRGSTSTVIATSTTTLTAGVWYYLELKVTLSNTTGTVAVRKDGAAVGDLALTGQDTCSTANEYATGAQVVLHQLQTAGQASTYTDDIYIADTSGSAPANDFLGEVRVQTLSPTGAGSSTQWTPSTGSNWAAVDEQNTLPGDGDYVSSSTATHTDLYAFADLSGSPTIFSVAVNLAARKDDAGTREVRTKLKSGGTTANGTTVALGSSYAAIRTAHDTDPATTAAWTVSGLNSAEYGVELVS